MVAVTLLLVVFLATVTISLILLIPLVIGEGTAFVNEDAPRMLANGKQWLAAQLGHEEVPEKWNNVLSEDNVPAIVVVSFSKPLSIRNEYAGKRAELICESISPVKVSVGSAPDQAKILPERGVEDVLASLGRFSHLMERHRESFLPPRPGL